MLKRRTTEQGSALPGGRPASEARKRRRRRRTSGVALRLFGGIAVALVLGYAALYTLLNGSRMQPAVESLLRRNLGREVRIGSVRFASAFGQLIASDVTVADDPAFSSSPFLHAESVTLSVNRLPLLLRRELQVTSVRLEEPNVTLIRSGARWNFHPLLASSQETGRGSAEIHVSRGIVAVRGGGGEPFVLREVAVDLPSFSPAADNVFTAAASPSGGGTLKVNGRVGPVKWLAGVPILPANVLINATGVPLKASNVTTSLAPSLDGLLSFDGSLESDGRALQLKGTTEIANLKLSSHGSPADQPLKASIGIEHDLGSGAGRLTRCDVALKQGAAGVTGTYAMSDGPTTVALQVSAHGVPVTYLGSLLPAAGLPLPPGVSLQSGVTFVELAVKGNLEGPAATGSVTMNNVKLMKFNLEQRLSSIPGLDLLHISPDLRISEMRAKVEMTPDRARLSEIEANVPEIGIFAGAGSIDKNQTLDFQMTAIRAGLAEKRPIPFVVRGACVAPVFQPAGKTS
jgi:AsmA protein